MHSADNPTVLVVEDDPICMQLQIDALMLADINVISAESGTQAFKILTEQKIDLVILDLKLPNATGIEILRRMRNEGFRQQVMICSASSHRQDVQRSLQLGAADYLLKPFSIKLLIQKVKAAIARGPVELPAPPSPRTGDLSEPEEKVSKGLEKFGDYFLGFSEEPPQN